MIELKDEYGVSVSSLVQWQCTGNLLDNGDAQKISIEQTCQGLEAAHAVGASVSLHTLGYLTPDMSYQEAYENAVSALSAIVPEAEKQEVALAVEFVWNGFLFSPLEMKRLLDDVGSGWVGFYFDPGNMALFQYPQQWVQALGGYIKAMHMKDWRGFLPNGSWKTGRGGNVLKGEWTPLLSGEVDFHSVMHTLKKTGFSGPFISEVDTFLAPIEQTLNAMKVIADMT